MIINPAKTLSALDPAVQTLLQELPEKITGHLQISTQLRKSGWESAQISSALTQYSLRQQALKKFSPADAKRMVFTPDSLQQASRAWVSRLHAKHFQDAGIKHVIDLGCGIGAESLAFAQADLHVTAVEIDPQVAEYATHNLSPYRHAQVITADATTLDLGNLEAEAFFADPARRQAGKRLIDPESWLPPLSTVMAWAEQLPGAAKVAPGIRYEVIPKNAHAQFTSVNGEVVEACLWFGKLAQKPGRSAAIIRDEKTYFLTDTDNPDPHQIIPAPVGPLGKYIYEPDGAIVRAGMLSTLAKRFNLHLIDPQIAYLTGDTHPHQFSPAQSTELLALTQAFQVIDTVGIHRKQINVAIAKAGFTAVDILTRGIDQDPQALRKQLKLVSAGKTADNSKNTHRRGAILLMRHDQKRQAILGLPIGPRDESDSKA